MKKALLTLACMLATIACHAQGQVNFALRALPEVNAQVFSDQAMTMGLQGNGYSIQLYGGPQGAAESALVAIDVPLVGFRTGANAGYPLLTKIVNVPGVPRDGRATLQVRAWDNAGGTITSWENASIRGQSALIVSGPLGGPDPTGANPPAIPPNLVGLQSFAIPEPSTIALGVLGAAALLLRRRK
jgi:hypothetical protein